jgi:hypothetical protein
MPDSKPRQNVLLVACEAGLIADQTEWLKRNHFASIQTRSIMKNLASWTTTLVTGVDSTKHNIFHNQVIDTETMTLRYANATDISYAPIWRENKANGKQTSTIDWPITDEDDSIDGHHSPVPFADDAHSHLVPEDQDLIRTCVSPIKHKAKAHEIAKRIEALRARTRKTVNLASEMLSSENIPDLTCMLIRDPVELSKKLPTFKEAQSMLLRTFIESLPKDMSILFIEKQSTGSNQGPSSDERPSPLNLLLRSPSLDKSQVTPISLASITPAIRDLLGLPHPMGALLPNWPFLSAKHAEDMPRPFPMVMEAPDISLQDMALKIVDMPTSNAADIQKQHRLAQNIIIHADEKSSINYRNNQWKQFADSAHALVLLRGTAKDYWLLTVVLDRLNQTEALKAHAADLQLVYEGQTFARIAEAITLKKHEKAKAQEILIDLKLDNAQLPLLASTAGRTAYQVGLNEKAEEFLDHALARNSTIHADRILLANLMMTKGDHAKALTAIGNIGSIGGDTKWRLLRSNVLIANNMLEEATRILQEILEENPLDTKAQAAMDKIRNRQNT